MVLKRAHPTHRDKPAWQCHRRPPTITDDRVTDPRKQGGGYTRAARWRDVRLQTARANAIAFTLVRKKAATPDLQFLPHSAVRCLAIVRYYCEKRASTEAKIAALRIRFYLRTSSTSLCSTENHEHSPLRRTTFTKAFRISIGVSSCTTCESGCG